MKSNALLKKEFDVLFDDQKRAWNHRLKHRRLVDQVLRESYEKWRSLVENAPDLIITVDRDGKIQFMNHNVPIEINPPMVGGSAFDYVLPEYQDLLRKAFKRVFKTGEPETLETACYGPKKTIAWTSCRIGAIKHAGEVISLIVISSDITKRKHFEDGYRHLASVVEYSNDAIISTTLKGTVLSWNQGAERLYGYRSHDIIDKNFTVLFPQDRQMEASQILSRIKRGESIANHETVRVKKDGKEIHVSMTVSPIQDGIHRTGISFISRDITEQKLLEKEILEISSREQYRLGHDLHDSLGQHLTGVTFLCTVLAQKLADKSLEEANDASRVAELISQATVKIRHIIRGLYPVQLESDGLFAALEELATQTEELFNVSCRFEYNKSISIQDSAYVTHLYRIAQEAVNNAIKHGKATHIKIEILSLPNRNVLIIGDDGKGIKDNQKINKGMGLHIMDYRARMIGGNLIVRRRSENGTIVTCSFKV